CFAVVVTGQVAPASDGRACAGEDSPQGHDLLGGERRRGLDNPPDRRFPLLVAGRLGHGDVSLTVVSPFGDMVNVHVGPSWPGAAGSRSRGSSPGRSTHTSTGAERVAGSG